MPILSLLTDFGLADYYVAAVKATVLRLAPGTELIDISHEVAPGDVEAAAFLLAAAAPSFPAGSVHLAVVDPGVGSSRRLLVAERTAPPAGLLVAPDNGLLTPLLTGARLVAVERDDLFLAAPSATFHGRDRFAPIAAWLLRGEPAAALGPEVRDPVRLEAPPPARAADRLAGRVIHVDRFGNLVTDLPSDWLPAACRRATGACRTAVDGHPTDLFAEHYAQVPPGQAALMPGSLGLLEVAARDDDLARRWSVRRGAAVLITWPSLSEKILESS